MADTKSILKDLTRVAARIGGDSRAIGVEPLFLNFIDMIRHVEADSTVKYYSPPPKELLTLSKEYQEKIKKFVEYTKGKQLSQKERNKILYG